MENKELRAKTKVILLLEDWAVTTEGLDIESRCVNDRFRLIYGCKYFFFKELFVALAQACKFKEFDIDDFMAFLEGSLLHKKKEAEKLSAAVHNAIESSQTNLTTFMEK